MPADDELIAGRYRLLSQIGRGAMGVVWRARDQRLDRTVAVKMLRVDNLPAAEVTERAIREGRSTARVRHPHAIMVHDVLEHSGTPCLVMEYFPAKSLAAQQSLAPQRIAAIGGQVADALSAAHTEGVVHRDVKPGNILIAADGTAKIADFGISRAVGDGTVTGTGLVLGTPAYLAPEVAGGASATFASDVFSLGASLYTALEGGPPFGLDENPIALLQRVAHDEITPPARSGPLVDVVLWMLRRDPSQRPTMPEAHAALTAVAQGRPVSPPPPRSLGTLPLAARRRSRRTIWAGAAAVCLVAGGVAIGTAINQTSSASQVAQTETRTVQPTATAPTTTTADSSGCQADFQVTNSWPGGYQASVTIHNTNGPPLTGWEVRWALPAGQTINTLWNGTLSQSGTEVTVRNESWNASVAANESTDFGLTANAPAEGEHPTLRLTCQAPR